MFEFWAVLVIYTFSLSFGQFPKECTLDKEVFDFECCPNTTLGVCGGPTRGSCVDITNKYAEGQCEKGNNSNSTYCLAQEFLKNRPGTNRTDFRYNWPTQIFHKVCNCSGNYDGYNCMRCKRGYTGESCSHSQVVVRKNVLNLTKRELDRFLEVLQTIKTSNTSGYTVAIIEPVTRESRDSFSEISLFDLFASFHFNAARDEDINSCNKSSTISQFCNVHTPCPVVDYAHEGPALLTWHRKFMLFVETEIQRVLNDSTFGFPYWDWTDEKTRNNIWNIAYMGSSNCGIFAEPPANSNTTQAPINGHFSNWSTICADSQQIVCNTQNQLCNPTKSSGKIQRCIGGTTGVQCRVQKMLPDTREFKIALKQRVYDHVPYHANNNTMGFRNSLEGFNYLIPRNQNVCTHFVEGFSTTELHNRVHIYVGGTMISVPASANDPIFYLHHSNVDRLYEEWLNTFSNKSFPSFQPSNFSYDVDPGHNIDEYLVPFFPTVTNRDMHHRATSFGYTYTQEKVITCPPLAAPDHGSIDCLSEGGRYLIGQLCLFKCDGGYELRGSASRRCQDNCTWNGTNTTCIRDGPPTNINAVTLSPRSIEVTWDPPEAYINDVSAYIILYNGTEGFADDGIVTVNRSSTRAIINGLEEFVSYDITVQAVYDARNIPSNPVRVMTWSDVPDGPPRDITIMDTDPAMLSVRYRPPPASSRNGDVTGYVIRYTRVGSGISQVITISDSSRGLRTSVIPALVAFVNYSGEVAAVNVNGTGPFSDVVYGLSGQDRPATAPRLLTADIIQSRFMTLSWMPPDTPNGIIIQYEVQYSVNSTTLLVNFADTLMGTVEGLSPVTLYTLQIRAYTRVGIGPFSSMITLMTLPEVPTPVPSVTIQSISSSMLTINWMEPDIPNGAITHYTVFYLPVSGPYGPIITSNRRKRQLVQDGEFAMDFTGTSGTLTNLNGSVTYRIQVSAVALNNIVGDRSDEKVIITNQRTPTEPCDIVATGVTQSSISLSWQRPDPPNGLITNYTVSYIAMVTYFNQTTGELGTFSINNSTTVLADDNIILSSLNFTDLRLGTEYQFTIVAYTNVGPGPEAMISVSTLHDVPPTPVILKLSTTDDTTVQIGIQPVPGHVMYYAVIVVIGGDETSSTNVKDISPFNEEEADTANSNDQPYTYITGIVETSDISDYPYPYVVGDESRSSIGGINYENVQLQTNTTYAVLVRAYTTDDLFSTSKALSVTTTITKLMNKHPSSKEIKQYT
ncbi:uncharacterized protein [Dysidea avara]|uniref:uncharacterized protein isoform X3 n=1 Tax=Dysidea avara TaxID=196820 RepID=UPI0033227898